MIFGFCSDATADISMLSDIPESILIFVSLIKEVHDHLGTYVRAQVLSTTSISSRIDLKKFLYVLSTKVITQLLNSTFS